MHSHTKGKLKRGPARGFRRFLVITVLKSVVGNLPMKNIIFEHLKEGITSILFIARSVKGKKHQNQIT